MAEETPKETSAPEPVVDEVAAEAPVKAEDTAEEASEDKPAAEEAADGAEGDDVAPADDDEEESKPRAKGGKTFRSNRNNRAVYHQSDNSDPSCRVYVGNLAWEVSWMDLKDHMKQSGCEVTRADILASPDGRSKGCGIVEFASADGAQRALLLNDTELSGRQIFVREDRESGNGGGYYTQKPGGGGGGFGAGSKGSSGGGAPAHVSGGEKQNCRVYVGNLSWEVAWQDLKDHMRDAGEVVFSEVMTEGDGRSKGCGIVEFSTPEEAKEACTTMSDTELKGRMIFVREDRETSSGGGGNQQGGYKGGASVYVGNLSYETSWQDLKDHMRGAGNVDQANVLKNEDGRSKGCGIVVYQHPRDAARAVRELQNSELQGRPIFVREDREQGGRRSGGNQRGGGNYRGGNRGGGHKSRGAEAAGGGSANGCQLFVGNLSYDTSWKELKDHFRQCGDVERVEVIEGPGGRKKGFGTVKFFNETDAENAISRLDGSELQGRELKVRLDAKAR